MPIPTRLLLAGLLVAAATPAAAQRWATVWAGTDQGPYPVGNASAQPDLSFAFPHPETGSHEQSFRLIIKPDLWGRQMRFRFSNSFGAKPVTFDAAFAGLQMSGAAVAAGTNRPVTFGGKKTVTVAPGGQVWSDARALPFVRDPADMAGRKLAVTFHIPGDSGPMTWHAKAMTTSYVTAPDAGAVGQLEDDAAFPNSTTSWFFLDAADAMAPADTRVVVCLGDSITDGTASTLNGDDRWTDVLSRRLHAVDAGRIAVVNAGIGGNQVARAGGVRRRQAVRGRPFGDGPAGPRRAGPVGRHPRRPVRGHQRSGRGQRGAGRRRQRHARPGGPHPRQDPRRAGDRRHRHQQPRQHEPGLRHGRHRQPPSRAERPDPQAGPVRRP